MAYSKLTTFIYFFCKSLRNLHETQSKYSVHNSYLIPSQFGALQSDKIHEIKTILMYINSNASSRADNGVCDVTWAPYIK